MKFKICAICLTLVLFGAMASRAHSPIVDADFSDWCFCEDSVDGICPNPSIRAPDTWDVLNCPVGTEVAWFDGEGDNLIVNDFNVLATTSDRTRLYFAATLYNDPDPASIPSAQVMLDVAPGGGNNWIDVEGNIAGTQDVAVNASPMLGADYNLVFDFTLFLAGSPDSCELRVWDPTGDPTSCVGIPQADCIRDGWRWLKYLQPAINPGQPGGSGGPPGGIELGIPWSDFDCAGCPPFGPDDAFQYTFMVAQGDTLLPFFTPGGPIEDNISEVNAGEYTTTTNSCATPGTDCELVDGSSDGFVAAGPQAGDLDDLVLDKFPGGLVRLSWGPSCIISDRDFAVYEGFIGSPGSQSTLTCSTDGLTDFSVSAAGGDVFYLVVPKSSRGPSSGTEGSYGQTLTGIPQVNGERSQATVPCSPQVTGQCPAGP